MSNSGNNDGPGALGDLTDRARDIFRALVETYLETGAPVGSRTLSRRIEEPLSAASVRNVMQDLEMLGLLAAPHTSAGRAPTDRGLRLFVDGLLQVGELSDEERDRIERTLGDRDRALRDTLDEAGAMLSGLSHGASLVFAPKRDAPIRHVEITPLPGNRVLIILAMEDGRLENRLIAAPPGLPPSAMQEAANFLNAHLRGLTLAEAAERLSRDIETRRAELDALTAELITAGAAEWAQTGGDGRDTLIVRGRSNLLDGVSDAADLERVRMLFDDLEKRRDLAQLLDLAQEGDGVRVFIGSENRLFSLSGSALVISPYMNADHKIIGAIGVIGPTRLNYARIVPIVDYTARLVGRIAGGAKRD